MSTSTDSSIPSGKLHIGLWVAQGFLAFAFLASGGFKAVSPASALLEAGMTMPTIALKIAGISEVLGAAGLILPSALRIQPKLTVLAAALLAVVMVLAVGGHVMQGEMQAIAPPIVLGALCAFVAWGRSSAAVIPPKAG